MTDHDRSEDSFDAFLRATAPEPLDDDGFVARAMAAVTVANRTLPVPRRATPRSPLAIARALVAEEQRHASQARLWRWAIGGVAVGYLLMLVAMALSPAGLSIGVASPSQWLQLTLTMCAGAFWVAWRTLRSS